jgi:glycosyltransferase involved in cell wall biosynthesis
VIVTAVGGAPEAVAEGVTGYIVAPGDVEALRNRMVRLAQDAPLRERMGEAARGRAEALFSIDGNVQKTEALYGEILASIDRG